MKDSARYPRYAGISHDLNYVLFEKFHLLFLMVEQKYANIMSKFKVIFRNVLSYPVEVQYGLI
jgi:hypothetical protein